MNQIVDKFLLAGDHFMSKLHLRQPAFTYSAFGQFTKNKERIQKKTNKKQEVHNIVIKTD